jgi:hypothetical protein
MTPAAAAFWLILFAGPPGISTAPADMEAVNAVGLFSLEQCYGTGVLMVRHLEDLHPGTSFGGACEKSPKPDLSAGEFAMTARQMLEAYEQIIDVAPSQ